MRKSTIKLLILIFVLIVLVVVLAIIDDARGSILIIVYDQPGHRIENANVKLIARDGIITRSNYSNKNGIATFYKVDSGTYDLLIYCDLEIFKKKGIILKRYDSIKIDITLTENHSLEPAEMEEYVPPLTLDELHDEEERYMSSWDTFNKQALVQTYFRNNGFVVFPSTEKDLYRSYIFSKEKKDNVFITTDLIFHTAHIFFDYSLRIIEIESLLPLIDKLSGRMIFLSERQFRSTKDIKIKDLSRLNTGFFSVVRLLLDPTFQPGTNIDELIEADYINTVEQKQITVRNLLTYCPKNKLYASEDFTQYIPRGHYTRNKYFKKYFKAMMWLERMKFKLRPGSTSADKEAGRMMTLQALLMTDALMNDEEALKNWHSLDNAISFFMGQSDDLGPQDYYPLIKEIFGASGSPDRFADINRLDLFIEKAMKLRDPKILSGLSYTDEGMFQTTSKGFSFLGQRSIPDGYIMQELVYSRKETGTILHYTGNGNPFTLYNDPVTGSIRGYPRGLDVMAALGSERAFEILEQEGDTKYTEFDAQMKKLRRHFSEWDKKDWESSLYNRSLNALRPLFRFPSGKSLPKIFRNPLWLDKELFTALGYWSELRHDTLLYSYQSYLPKKLAFYGEELDKLKYPSGYIEPYPDLYDRIRKMLIKQVEILSKLNSDNKEINEKNVRFQEVLEKLTIFSKAEIDGKVLSQEEYESVQGIGETLKEFKTFSPELKTLIASGSDDRMDVIADVFTNPWDRQVLEEGVGSPMYIFVYIDDVQGRRICRGMTYSYYEFKQPMNDRLSDEKWQRMGKQHNRPALPAWTKSFIVNE